MALVVKDRVRETTTTVGTGTLTLNGAVAGFQSFSVIGNGNTTYYTISDGTTGAWEVGIGTYTSSGTTLSRDTVLESSNSNNLVNFSAGTKDVFVTYPADRSVTSDVSTTFTAAQTFRAANAVRSEAAATQDAVVVAGRAGGTNSYAVTLTPTTLTASRTFTFPDADGTALYSGGPLGTPSSGTVTNLTGTASININGTVGATTPNTGSFTSLTDSGNLTFTGTGNRILGDFSNATVASRVMFQGSTTNATTAISIIPNGTAQTSSLNVHNGSDPANAAYAQLRIDTTSAQVTATYLGTGSYLPLVFNTGGSERMRLDTSGNLGIGTSSPGCLLNLKTATNSITETLRLQNDNNVADNGNKVTWRNAGTAFEAAYVGATRVGASVNYALTFATSADISAANATERMRIDGSGNVGIGTSSPGTKFDVLSGTANTVGDSITSAVATFTTQNYNFATGSNPAGLQVMSNSTLGADVGATIGLGGRYTGTQFAQFAIIKGAKENATDGNFSTYLAFGTRINGGNITERMRIDSSGSVGIGTSSPSAPLQVIYPYAKTDTTVRNALQLSSNDVSNKNTLSFASTGAASQGSRVWSLQTAELGVTDAGSLVFQPYGGNVGIGTSSPSNKLDVNGNMVLLANGQLKFADASNSYVSIIKNSGASSTSQIEFLTGATPTERMRIDSSGNVGIGATPAASTPRLQVTSAFSAGSALSPYNGVYITSSDAQAADKGGVLSLGGLYDASSGPTRFAAIAGLKEDSTSGNYGGYMAFYTRTNGSATAERMRIDSSGNVGIGTSSPGSFNAAGLPLVVGSGSGNQGLTIYAGTASYGGIHFADGTSGDASYRGIVYYQHSTDNMQFWTAAAERMRIDSSGNVIVNTAAIATNATNGFLYVPTCAGTPTGTPTAYTGRAPIVVDTTNNKLYFYSGGAWRDAGP